MIAGDLDARVVTHERPAFCARCGWHGRGVDPCECPACEGPVMLSVFDGVEDWRRRRLTPLEGMAAIAALLPEDIDPDCDGCGQIVARCECP